MTFCTEQSNDLLQVQIGRQAVWGTAVAPTLRLAGIQDFTMNPVQERNTTSSKQGLAPIYDVTVSRTEAQGTMEGLMNYEHIPYFLDGLFGRDTTPTGGGPFTRDYAAPLTDYPTDPRMSTMYLGTGTAGYSLIGGIPSGLNWSVEDGGDVTFTVPLIGQRIEVDAPTAALGLITPTVASSPQVSLFMDDFATDIIAELAANNLTAYNGTIFSISMDLNANRTSKFGIGFTNPSCFYDRAWEGTLSFTSAYGDPTTTKDIIDTFIGGGIFQRNFTVRMVFDANHEVNWSFAGTLTNDPVLWDDSEGLSVASFEFTGTFNSVIGNWLIIQSINNDAALVD